MIRAHLGILLALIIGATPARGIVVDTAPSYTSIVVTGNQTRVVKTGFGTLHVVVIGNGATGGAISLYDGTAVASGALIGTLVSGTPSGGLLSGSGNPAAVGIPLDIDFKVGLTVVTSGSTNNSFTVIYQ